MVAYRTECKRLLAVDGMTNILSLISISYILRYILFAGCKYKLF